MQRLRRTLLKAIGAAAPLMRAREDYGACLPDDFTSYRGSPSAAVRGDWAFRAANAPAGRAAAAAAAEAATATA